MFVKHTRSTVWRMDCTSAGWKLRDFQFGGYCTTQGAVAASTTMHPSFSGGGQRKSKEVWDTDLEAFLVDWMCG